MGRKELLQGEGSSSQFEETYAVEINSNGPILLCWCRTKTVEDVAGENSQRGLVASALDVPADSVPSVRHKGLSDTGER